MKQHLFEDLLYSLQDWGQVRRPKKAPLSMQVAGGDGVVGSEAEALPTSLDSSLLWKKP